MSEHEYAFLQKSVDRETEYIRRFAELHGIDAVELQGFISSVLVREDIKRYIEELSVREAETDNK